MRILLVEDDRRLGNLIQYKLNKQYHRTEWVMDGAEALERLSISPYELYILDWMVPSYSGVELCGLIRSKGDRAPILMLTARDAVSDRVEGLMAGADDYVIKPFDFDELFARLHVLERRKAADWREEIKQVQDLTLNMRTFEAQRGGTPIQLARREFQLLSYLMSNAGNVLDREQLLNQVWGLDAEVTPNAVDASIKLLRKKIRDTHGRQLIQSVRGFGYRMAP